MQIYEMITCVCAYHCAQPLNTTQYRTVRIIFPPNLQTIIVAQMLPVQGEGGSQPWSPSKLLADPQPQCSYPVVTVTQQKPARRRSSQPISWTSTEKLNLTQQKQTCIRNKIQN